MALDLGAPLQYGDLKYKSPLDSFSQTVAPYVALSGEQLRRDHIKQGMALDLERNKRDETRLGMEQTREERESKKFNRQQSDWEKDDQKKAVIQGAVLSANGDPVQEGLNLRKVGAMFGDTKMMADIDQHLQEAISLMPPDQGALAMNAWGIRVTPEQMASRSMKYFPDETIDPWTGQRTVTSLKRAEMAQQAELKKMAIDERKEARSDRAADRAERQELIAEQKKLQKEAKGKEENYKRAATFVRSNISSELKKVEKYRVAAKNARARNTSWINNFLGEMGRPPLTDKDVSEGKAEQLAQDLLEESALAEENMKRNLQFAASRYDKETLDQALSDIAGMTLPEPPEPPVSDIERAGGWGARIDTGRPKEEPTGSVGSKYQRAWQIGQQVRQGKP
jgi:hypothetical protein